VADYHTEPQRIHMGWLRLVGSIKVQVCFAKEPYKRDYVLQKRPIILSILLTVATPYRAAESHNNILPSHNYTDETRTVPQIHPTEPKRATETSYLAKTHTQMRPFGVLPSHRWDILPSHTYILLSHREPQRHPTEPLLHRWDSSRATDTSYWATETN